LAGGESGRTEKSGPADKGGKKKGDEEEEQQEEQQEQAKPT
jgi:hypothetical protein